MKNISRTTSNILKPYPSYVERQIDVAIHTTSNDESIEIDNESKIKIPELKSFIRAQINYIDTNPLGDKNQPLILIVHGYPGTHESTRNFIEELQQRNFRCIAPDMPCKLFIFIDKKT